MKRSLAIALILASGLALNAAAQIPDAPTPSTSSSSAAPAAAPAQPAGPAKVAIVAFEAVVAQTNEGRRDLSDLQKKFEPKRTELKSLSDEIDSLKKDLQTQGDKLSDAERASRTKTIDDKEKQLRRSAEDAQSDFQQQMQTIFNSLSAKVYDVLETYAKEHGYTLVIDVSSQQQSPVLYAAPNTIINKEVIDAYNAKSGVPAQPEPAAPAPASATPSPQ